MRIHYDSAQHILSIVVSDYLAIDAVTLAPNVIAHYDRQQKLAGIELLDLKESDLTSIFSGSTLPKASVSLPPSTKKARTVKWTFPVDALAEFYSQNIEDLPEGWPTTLKDFVSVAVTLGLYPWALDSMQTQNVIDSLREPKNLSVKSVPTLHNLVKASRRGLRRAQRATQLNLSYAEHERIFSALDSISRVDPTDKAQIESILTALPPAVLAHLDTIVFGSEEIVD